MLLKEENIYNKEREMKKSTEFDKIIIEIKFALLMMKEVKL